MTDIPLFRPYMSPDAPARVAETLMSGYLGQGPRVDEFEAAFATWAGVPEVLATNSGTAALHLAMRLIGGRRWSNDIMDGSEVITTPITCTATNTAPALAGYRLVWADVDPLTGLIDPDDVRRKLTRRTRAIIAVDWGGRPCDYQALRSFGVPVVQDAAHLPLDYTQRGDYVCWSFQAIKHLTTGDGGALLAPPEQMERARLLRWYGLDRRSSADFRCEQNIQEIGDKLHMNDIAATIGLANLADLRGRLLSYQVNAAHIYNDLCTLGHGVDVPYPGRSHSYWLFTILVNDRDAFRAHLAARGIATSLVHGRNDAHDAFRRISTGWPLPGVDEFDRRQVNIPVGWWLTDEDRRRVIDAAVSWAERPALVTA